MKLRAALDNNCKAIDAELDLHFAAPDSELSDQARRHLKECERCRQLCRWISEPVPGLVGAHDLCARVQRMLPTNFAPISPLPPTRVLAIEFLVTFVLFAFLMIGILGFVGFQHMGLPQLISIISILAIGAIGLSFSLARCMIPGSLHRFSTGIAVVVSSLGFFACIAILFPWHFTRPFVAEGWPCSAVGAGIALLAALLFWLLLRRGAILSGETLGRALGAVSGLMGVTVLQVRCSRQEAGHLLVWHGGLLVVSILAGILVARICSAFGARRS